jgi:hypothetical protein
VDAVSFCGDVQGSAAEIDKAKGGVVCVFCVNAVLAGGDGEGSVPDADAVIGRINSLGVQEMWDEASPIWLRPQVYADRMYKEDELLQVVGHTPVERFIVRNNVLSCDVFSTYRTLDPIGTQEFLLFGTANWHYGGLK